MIGTISLRFRSLRVSGRRRTSRTCSRVPGRWCGSAVRTSGTRMPRSSSKLEVSLPVLVEAAFLQLVYTRTLPPLMVGILFSIPVANIKLNMATILFRICPAADAEVGTDLRCEAYLVGGESAKRSGKRYRSPLDVRPTRVGVVAGLQTLGVMPEGRGRRCGQTCRCPPPRTTQHALWPGPACRGRERWLRLPGPAPAWRLERCR